MPTRFRLLCWKKCRHYRFTFYGLGFEYFGKYSLFLEDNGTPAPQVKVGADGNIILDEESLMIETTTTKKAKNDLITAPLVFENANSVSYKGFTKSFSFLQGKNYLSSSLSICKIGNFFPIKLGQGEIVTLWNITDHITILNLCDHVWEG